MEGQLSLSVKQGTSRSLEISHEPVGPLKSGPVANLSAGIVLIFMFFIKKRQS